VAWPPWAVVISWFPSSGLGTHIPEALLRSLGSIASRVCVPKLELGNESERVEGPSKTA